MTASQDLELMNRHAQHWDPGSRTRSLRGNPWLWTASSGLYRPEGRSLTWDVVLLSSIARFFIDKDYQVTGTDSSPSLIDICRRRFPKQHWIVADMRKFDLNARFEGIIAWDSLFTSARKISAKCSRSSQSIPPQTLRYFSPVAQQVGKLLVNIRGEPLYHGNLDAEGVPRIAGREWICRDGTRRGGPYLWTSHDLACPAPVESQRVKWRCFNNSQFQTARLLLYSLAS